MENKEPWTVVEVMPSLGVGDLREAITFYRKLGFVWEWDYPEGAEASHVGISFGDVNLMLARCADRPIERQNMYFVMQGIDAYHRELRARLGETVPELVDSDYGMRDFAVRDPWGHLLTFGQESSRR